MSMQTFLDVLQIEADSLLAAKKRLAENEDSRAHLEKALALIARKLDKEGKVIVTGIGKSGKIAKKIAATLSSVGNLAVYLHPSEGLHGDLGLLHSKDVVIAISYSGDTAEIVELLPSIKARGIPIVAITGRKDSILAREANCILDAYVEREACASTLAPTSSTTLALALGDALAIWLMKHRKISIELFAQNHPGGNLGRRLRTNVEHLLHPLDVCAWVGPESSADQVVTLATERKLGGVLVLDARKKLAGLITDGDIRRALRQGEGFFKLKAKEFMTPTPSTVLPEEKAILALEKMENRDSQISVLPVVDNDQHVVGMIRLHDLVKHFS